MKIKEAAMIWDRDGKVYTGFNHAQIIHSLAQTVPKSQWPIKGIQGFITDTGLFVDRVEGLRIAKEAGQINHKHGNPNELFSEDINFPNGFPKKD